MENGIRISVYRAGGTWYAALWIDGEYDSCDALDVPNAAPEAEAMAAAEAMPLRVDGVREVRRVEDVSR